jgi:flagellar motor switch protein FliM
VSARTLSQQEIDGFFQSAGKGERGASEPRIAPFDFRRLDRIPKSQLSVIHFLHEAFVKNLASSLSLYLRSYVSGNLISVEQMPFADFVDSLPSPNCIVYLTMQPYDGHALVEINHSLLAPILDHVLGGNGKIKTDLDREITDVEEDMLEGLFRIISNDLVEAWKVLVPIKFSVDSLERKPQLSKRIARNEAVVTIAMEIRVGEAAGMINLVIPSITLKMMHEKFDQRWTIRKSETREMEDLIARGLSDKLQFEVDLALLGATVSLKDLLELKVGNLIDLGLNYNGKATVLVNGVPKFTGDLTAVGRKRGLVIDSSGREPFAAKRSAGGGALLDRSVDDSVG